MVIQTLAVNTIQVINERIETDVLHNTGFVVDCSSNGDISNHHHHTVLRVSLASLSQPSAAVDAAVEEALVENRVVRLKWHNVGLKVCLSGQQQTRTPWTPGSRDFQGQDNNKHPDPQRAETQNAPGNTTSSQEKSPAERRAVFSSVFFDQDFCSDGRCVFFLASEYDSALLVLCRRQDGEAFRALSWTGIFPQIRVRPIASRDLFGPRRLSFTVLLLSWFSLASEYDLALLGICWGGELFFAVPRVG